MFIVMKEIGTNSKPSLHWTNILVPVDFSEPSNHALKIAAGLAEKLGARLTILHVLHMPACYPTDALVDLDDLLSSGRNSMEHLTYSFSAALIREKRVQFGKLEISEEIVEAAYGLPADLIVLGTHAYGGVARILHRNIAERVIQHAPCPVLALPPGKDFSHLATRYCAAAQF
jgi:nucleotide-binding universal stress UspA family protein